MSVYHEALKSGRITLADAASLGSFRAALKRAKRHEAMARNESTPYERTRAARREEASRA